jgi:hypothetical protein
MRPIARQGVRPERTAIEWYDSDILAIIDQPPTLILDLRAIAHRSHGEPGTDAGSVWVQSAAVILDNGRWDGPRPAPPCTIAHGQIEIDHHEYENRIRCPFSSNGRGILDLTLASGESFSIESDQLTVTFTGEPEFLEDFVPESIEDGERA